MTVYIVKFLYTSVDDESIKGIFSTREKAEDYIQTKKEDYRTSFWVEEYELDSGDWV